MQIDLSDLAIPAGIALLDFIIDKTPLKSNTAIDVILDVLKIVLGGKKMKFLLILPILFFIGCSKVQREEIKETTARGLGEGLSAFLQGDSNLLCEKPILECENPEMARDYLVQKSCDLLNAECGPSSISSSSLVQRKGFLSKFICRSAVKVVLPALMPSNQLPDYLKNEAKCKASCLDELTSDNAPKVCDKI